MSSPSFNCFQNRICVLITASFRSYALSLCNFLTKLIATGDDKKGLYLHVIVRKIPCAPAACLHLLESTFRFVE